MPAEHPTPIIHERTEPLRELVKQLDAAPGFAKLAYARELGARSVTLLAELCHAVEKLEARLATLERFPELRN